MEIATQIAQLLLSLGLLVITHELGHFWAARAFKTRVDKFYLFFNPWFSIFRAKRINRKWQLSWFSPAPPKSWASYPENTEWGLGWLPLGGSCKIAGMIDEHMDTDTVKQPMQAWEYRAKPAWQRLIMIIGGVVVNFVSALIIYAMILYTWGREYIPIANATYGYDYCQPALSNGFANGDLILAVDGKTPETLGDAVKQILYADGNPVTLTLLRAGDTVQLTLPADFSQQLLAANVKYFAQERIPFVVEQITGGSPAAAAKLQRGDSIVGVNGANAPFLAQLSDSLLRYAGKPIVINFYRNGALLSQEVTPTENGKLGVGLRSPISYFKTKRLEYGFLESLPAGVALGTETLVSYVKQFKIIFTKEGAKSLGGFGTIGSLFDKTWNWPHFWSMTAFLAIILAFLNILPIPAFDGGHMMFILYEMVSGRKPSDKLLERAQMVGLVIIILLFVFANGNDIMRWLASR
ncbi:MAG: RIP metalloprotease RseP [Prevotellaceae bacterium]|jgi:regulator of sigma E protease|nr:RIP metalloprotease RseP [Prevotellaceae bacterium]